MKKRPKRLELHTETLRRLDRGLAQVAAGDDLPTPPIFTCTIPTSITTTIITTMISDDLCIDGEGP